MVDVGPKMKISVPKVTSIDDVIKSNPVKTRDLKIIPINSKIAPQKSEIEKGKERQSRRSCHDQEIDLSSFLEKEVYLDGMGHLRIGCDDVRVNLILLENCVIDAFLVDWADYYDNDTFCLVIDALKYYSMSKPWVDKLKFYPTKFGVLVTTFRKWILGDMCLELRSKINKYMVSQISSKDLNEILAPISLLSKLPPLTRTKLGHDTIRGDRYVVYVRDVKLDHSSIILRKFNENCQKYVQKFVRLVQTALGEDYQVSLHDANQNVWLIGELVEKVYDPGEVLDPDVDFEGYLQEINEECEQLYRDDNIHKLILSMVC